MRLVLREQTVDQASVVLDFVQQLRILGALHRSADSRSIIRAVAAAGLSSSTPSGTRPPNLEWQAEIGRSKAELIGPARNRLRSSRAAKSKLDGFSERLSSAR